MPFSQAELIERRSYLGASESAAALGMSDWFTPLQLYKSKIGEGEAIEETLPMMVGIALEPVVIRQFEKEEGFIVTRRQESVVDPLHPWRRTTLDGWSSDNGIVEAKSSGMWGWWGKEDDAVPPSVHYQVQHQMACTGATHAWVPVIVGQREYRIYRIERSESMIELMTEGEHEFMQRVINRDPPPAVNRADLMLRYPADVGIKVVADTVTERVAYDRNVLKQKIKELEKEAETQAFVITNFMKDASVLTDSHGKPLYTYNSSVRHGIDVKTLRTERPDIAAMYERETPVRTLLCKIK